jgi:hypothetical protein
MTRLLPCPKDWRGCLHLLEPHLINNLTLGWLVKGDDNTARKAESPPSVITMVSALRGTDN